MGIGVSVFLLAVGAILAFALSDQQVGVLDLNAVGWILMAAGVVGIIVTTMIWGGRRRSTVVTERPTTAITEEPVAYRRAEPATRYRRVDERTSGLPPEDL